MISVVIVDDHPIVRAGLRAVLETASDICLIGEGSCGADALQLVETLQPDVLVLDLNLPDMNGLEVTRQICSRKVATATLILTIHRDSVTLFQLLEQGALGYVLKDEALETLVNAVRAVARGENWLSPAVATQVVRRAVGGAQIREGQRQNHPANLTPREIEVLRLLAQGLDNTTIAGQLVLTTRTIQNHVSNIYGKLGVTNRTEAVLFAIRHGLVQVTPEDSKRDA